MMDTSSPLRHEAKILVEAWAQAFNTGRIADLARFYGQDARLVPPGRSTLVGVGAICAFFADLRAQGFHDYAIDVGDGFMKEAFLVTSGRWAIRGPYGGGAELYRGNWLILLAPGPTGRLIAVQMWN